MRKRKGAFAAALLSGSLHHGLAFAAPPDARPLTEVPVVLVETPDAEGRTSGMLPMFASKERLVIADGNSINLKFHSEDIEDVGGEEMGALSSLQRFEVEPYPRDVAGLASCEGRANLMTVSQWDDSPRELTVEFYNEYPDFDHFGSAAQSCAFSSFRIVHDMAETVAPSATISDEGAPLGETPRASGNEDAGSSPVADDRRQALDDALASVMSDAPEPPGMWIPHVTENPMDDSKTVTLTLFAEEGASRRGDPVRLIARCKSNTTELYIDWNDYLGNDSYAGRGDYKYVEWRLGSRKAVEDRWGLSTDLQATFAPDWAGNLLKEMVKEERLVVRTTPYNKNPVTAVFDIRGLRAHLGELAETCGWSFK